MYFKYIGATEAPATYHRWSCLTILGAWIGRRYHLPFGHRNINSNVYTMLMGGPGARKNTAINIATDFIKAAGYDSISAERTTKEKFLQDLAGVDINGASKDHFIDPEDVLEINLFGEDAISGDAEILIKAPEFNIFVGNGNIEFLSLLGELWDYHGEFEDRKKNSKSFKIQNPTVSILAGNTPTGFSLAFPAEAIGQGIFSRLVLVHGESTGKKITIPPAPDKTIGETLQAILREVRKLIGIQTAASFTPTAYALINAIYHGELTNLDVRFESYVARRLTHLIKLCLIISASSLRIEIIESDVVYANTILTHTEHSMSKALGEFGKARHSDVSHKLVQILENAYVPIPLKQLWTQLHNDLEDLNVLKDMLSNLQLADKIIGTKGGFLAKRKILDEVGSKYVDFSMLTNEERRYVS